MLLAGLLAGCSSAPKPAPGPGASGHAAPGSPKVWKPGVPDTTGPVVAVVGSRKITRHEIDSLIATAPPNLQPQLREPEGYRQVVDRTVTQEAIYQAAIRDSVSKDPQFQGELARTTHDLMMRRYYQLAIARLPEIPDSVAQAFYETHQEQFTIAARAQIRHILLATRSQAQSVRGSLVKGAPWDATCKAKSIDKATRENGGLLGYIAPDNDMVPGVGKAPAIVAAAFSLEIGAISQPLRSPGGWNLIKVEARQDRTVEPYEDAKPRIVAELTTQRQNEFGKTLADSLKAYSNAVIFDDSIAVALDAPKGPDVYFKEAQSAATPTQRIDLYRALIKKYPDAHVSIQARFMIGFTYVEELGEPDLARQEFQEFLRLYPNSELAGSARWMLENMDKPPPEMDDEGTPPGGQESSPPDSGKTVAPGGTKTSP